MFIADLLTAAIIAIILTLIVAMAFGRRGPWGSIAVLFLVIFLTTWLVGIWATPYGPAVRGIYVIPFLFFGIAIALLLAAATPYRPPLKESREEPEGEVSESRTVFNAFFWVFLVVMVVLILTAYF